MMSQKEIFIQSLVQWASSHQAYLHPDVEIYDDPVTGLSFKAVQNLPPASKLVTCPFQISLSYLNAIELSCSFLRHQSEPLPTEFLEILGEDDPNIIGHFFLVQQYLLGDKSFWWPYIRLLPQPDQPELLGIPIWWPEGDQRFLAGTNADPPIKKRKEMWMAEWDKGISILRNHLSDWESFHYTLYQWAATIFGTRSFRASLAIPDQVLGNDSKNLNHVMKDRFSILLPVLDIGNHNGINQVDWKRDSTDFGLWNQNSVPEESQIFNFYGDKSNSELLVGYGFMLPNREKDTINLQLRPGPDALLLRRSQICFKERPHQHEDEFMFSVRSSNIERGYDGRLNKPVEFQTFSEGLVDLVSCMVANKREQRFILSCPDYCIENDTAVFEGFMSRNALLVLSLLQAKLEQEVKRIQDCGADLGEPQSRNQLMAVEYRDRQLDVLKDAIPQIVTRLNSALTVSNFCQHGYRTARSRSDHEDGIPSEHSSVELLSLECGFEWLQVQYPDVFSSVVEMISEDQDEPLPLDWAILVDDWDHTYWVVWIYIVWTLWARDDEDFRLRHKCLNKWMARMNEFYDEAADTFHAEPSEQATIDYMVHGISQISSLMAKDKQGRGKSHPFTTTLRNFASLVAKEETVSIAYEMRHSSQPGKRVQQKMLCMNMNTTLTPS